MSTTTAGTAPAAPGWRLFSGNVRPGAWLAGALVLGFLLLVPADAGGAGFLHAFVDETAA
jgi:hypothetical protein